MLGAATRVELASLRTSSAPLPGRRPGRWRRACHGRLKPRRGTPGVTHGSHGGRALGQGRRRPVAGAPCRVSGTGSRRMPTPPLGCALGGRRGSRQLQAPPRPGIIKGAIPTSVDVGPFFVPPRPRGPLFGTVGQRRAPGQRGRLLLLSIDHPPTTRNTPKATCHTSIPPPRTIPDRPSSRAYAPAAATTNATSFTSTPSTTVPPGTAVLHVDDAPDANRVSPEQGAPDRGVGDVTQPVACGRPGTATGELGGRSRGCGARQPGCRRPGPATATRTPLPRWRLGRSPTPS